MCVNAWNARTRVATITSAGQWAVSNAKVTGSEPV